MAPTRGLGGRDQLRRPPARSRPVEPFAYAALWNEPLRGDRGGIRVRASSGGSSITSARGFPESGSAPSSCGAGTGSSVFVDSTSTNRQQEAPASISPTLRRARCLRPSTMKRCSRGVNVLADGHRIEQVLRFDEGNCGLAGVRMTLDGRARPSRRPSTPRCCHCSSPSIQRSRSAVPWRSRASRKPPPQLRSARCWSGGSSSAPDGARGGRRDRSLSRTV